MLSYPRQSFIFHPIIMWFPVGSLKWALERSIILSIRCLLWSLSADMGTWRKVSRANSCSFSELHYETQLLWACLTGLSTFAFVIWLSNSLLEGAASSATFPFSLRLECIPPRSFSFTIPVSENEQNQQLAFFGLGTSILNLISI